MHLALYLYTVSFHPCLFCMARAPVIVPVLQMQNLTQLASKPSAEKWRERYLGSTCLTSNSALLTTSCISSSLLLLLQISPDSPIHLHTSSFPVLVPQVRSLNIHHGELGEAHLDRPNVGIVVAHQCILPSPRASALFLQLARMYPNMELELEMSPESAPLLMFTPGNVTLMPVIDVQAFALKPNSSDRKPLFQLRVVSVPLDRAAKGSICQSVSPSLYRRTGKLIDSGGYFCLAAV